MGSGGFLTITEFAKLCGVGRASIYLAIKTGRVKVKLIDNKKMIDAEKGLVNWRDNADPVARKKGNTKKKTKKAAKKKQTPKTKVVKVVEPDKFQGMTTADADRKEKVYRAKLSELKYLEQAGNLLKKEDVQRQSFESARKVRDSIMNLPARFCHELAIITDPHKLEIKLSKLLTTALEQGMRGENEK